MVDHNIIPIIIIAIVVIVALWFLSQNPLVTTSNSLPQTTEGYHPYGYGYRYRPYGYRYPHRPYVPYRPYYPYPYRVY